MRDTSFLTQNLIAHRGYHDIKIGIAEIGITGVCDELTKAKYVHELYHALMYKNKGSIKNMLNNEAISIFMEQVAATDLKRYGQLDKQMALYRLLHLKKTIMNREMLMFCEERPREIIEDESYILSTANASSLFHT